MRILLDECIPRKLAGLLPFQVVSTVPHEGWSSLKNGRLLSFAAEKFDVFLTVDDNIPNQQNLQNYDIGLVIIQVPSNRLKDIQPLLPQIEVAIKKVKSNSYQIVKNDC